MLGFIRFEAIPDSLVEKKMSSAYSVNRGGGAAGSRRCGEGSPKVHMLWQPIGLDAPHAESGRIGRLDKSWDTLSSCCCCFFYRPYKADFSTYGLGRNKACMMEKCVSEAAYSLVSSRTPFETAGNGFPVTERPILGSGGSHIFSELWPYVPASPLT